MRTLVLWDIDHTLISVRGLSSEIVAEVFETLIGHPLEKIAGMAGRTDLAIISETLRLNQVVPGPELMSAFSVALGDAFTERRDEIKARGRELAGGRAALAVLAAREDVVQSVLTGNMKRVAACKLTAFGLHEFVDLEIGAYGLDHMDRPPLVRLAQRRAADKHGESFGPAATVLIGDTPKDVEAGHRGGARVVAVATGSSDEDTLRAAGAEVVLADLTDTDSVVRAVLTG